MSQIELVAEDGIRRLENTMESPLSIQGITVSYGEKPAVFSIDYTVPSQQMVAIIGPNGAGKSTLIRSVLGIVPKLSGMVHVFGEPLEKMRQHIAYVPQRASVDWDFPARVIDVVLMGLYREVGFFNFISAKNKKKALECLDRVSMVDFAHRQIGQLSGGQQQRVFLARALAQDAALYLLDEPFAGVDAATERAIVDVLKDLKADQKTVVCVHHDLSTVREYFDHVLFVNVRKVAEGPVSSAFNAENLQLTYGGRLAATHIDELQLGAG